MLLATVGLAVPTNAPPPKYTSVTTDTNGNLTAPLNLWTQNAAAISAAISGGASQTPLTTDVNGAHFSITNLNKLQATNSLALTNVAGTNIVSSTGQTNTVGGVAVYKQAAGALAITGNATFAGNGGSTSSYVPTATDSAGNWSWQAPTGSGSFSGNPTQFTGNSIKSGYITTNAVLNGTVTGTSVGTGASQLLQYDANVNLTLTGGGAVLVTNGGTIIADGGGSFIVQGTGIGQNFTTQQDNVTTSMSETVSNQTTLKGWLFANGASNTFTGPLDIQSTATNRGATTMLSTLNVAGFTSVAGESNSVNGGVAGTLVVAGAQTNLGNLKVLGTTTMTGFTNNGTGGVGGTLVVAGAQTNLGNVVVLGTLTAAVAGDVTGTTAATVVSTVGGVTAANVASGATAANNATTSTSVGTIVLRDNTGAIYGNKYVAMTLTPSNIFAGLGTLSGVSGGNVFTISGSTCAAMGLATGYNIQSPNTGLPQYRINTILNTTQFTTFQAVDSHDTTVATYMVYPNAMRLNDINGNQHGTIENDSSISVDTEKGGLANSGAFYLNAGSNTVRINIETDTYGFNTVGFQMAAGTLAGGLFKNVYPLSVSVMAPDKCFEVLPDGTDSVGVGLTNRLGSFLDLFGAIRSKTSFAGNAITAMSASITNQTSLLGWLFANGVSNTFTGTMDLQGTATNRAAVTMLSTLNVAGQTSLTGFTNNGTGGVSGTLVIGGAQTNLGNLVVLGTMSGNGSGITTLNGSSVSSGTVANARLNIGVGANQILALDAGANLNLTSAGAVTINGPNTGLGNGGILNISNGSEEIVDVNSAIINNGIEQVNTLTAMTGTISNSFIEKGWVFASGTSNTWTGTEDHQGTSTNRAAVTMLSTLSVAGQTTLTGFTNNGTGGISGNLIVGGVQTNLAGLTNTSGDIGNGGTLHQNGTIFATGTTNLVTGRTVFVGTVTNLGTVQFNANGGSTLNFVPTATDANGNWTWQAAPSGTGYTNSTATNIFNSWNVTNATAVFGVNINTNGNINATGNVSIAGQFNGSGAGLTSIASNALPSNIVYTNGGNSNIFNNLNLTNATAATGISLGTNGIVSCNQILATNIDTIQTSSGVPAAGHLGEPVQSLVAVGSAVSLTTATTANVTSISLTAGDWRVSGNVNYTSTTATVTGKLAGISSTSVTMPTDGSEVPNGTQMTLLSAKDGTALPEKIFHLSGTTTVYLEGQATFSAGSVSAYGQITARRND